MRSDPRPAGVPSSADRHHREKFFHVVQQILSVNLEPTVDKKRDCCLPRGSHIQQVPVTDSIELPEEFLQAIGKSCVPGVSAGDNMRGAAIGNRHRGARARFVGRGSPVR